jgi:hypothetical protein
MSERDSDFYPQGQGPAVPDPSRSTAQFRAFANRAAGESEAPWAMRAPGRKVALLAGVVIVVAVVLALIALAVAG